MTSLVKILELLPALSDAERDHVTSAIKALRQLGTAMKDDEPVVSQGEDHEFLVLSCIAEALRNVGAELVSTRSLRAGVDAGFRAKLPDLMAFVASHCPTRAAQRGLLLLGFELLYGELCRLRVPASGRVMMRHLHRFPAVLNRAFPGYAQSGLLGFVVDKSIKV